MNKQEAICALFNTEPQNTEAITVESKTLYPWGIENNVQTAEEYMQSEDMCIEQFVYIYDTTN